MQKYGYIYKITNAINGKVYIGQHKWDGDGLDPNYFCSSNNPHFWNAINKYGIDNFNKELVQYCYSRKSLNILETTWIKYYRRVLGIDNVYNISSGGDDGWAHINELKFTDPEKYSAMIDKLLDTNRENHGGVLAWNTRESINRSKTTRLAKYGTLLPNCYTEDAINKRLATRDKVDPSLSKSFNNEDSINRRNETKLSKYGSKAGPMISEESLRKSYITRSSENGYYKSDKIKELAKKNLNSDEARRKANIKCIFKLPDGKYVVKCKRWVGKNKYNAEFICEYESASDELLNIISQNDQLTN